MWGKIVRFPLVRPSLGGVGFTKGLSLMRVLTVAAAIGVMLVSSPIFAQSTQPKPAAPAAPKPAAPSAPPQAPAPRPAPPAMPFPEGAKVAIIDYQRIIAESAEGKAASTKMKALDEKKGAEMTERQKQLQSAQQQLQTGGGVLSDTARADLQRRIERMDTDMQRFTQDAQKELQDLQQQLQIELNRKLNPVLDEVAKEKGLHAVFSVSEAGFAWVSPGLDITADVIKRLDAKK
jgi:outer membrane protein